MRSIARNISIATAVITLLATPSSGITQDMSDEDYIAARIGHYREMGASLKALNDELKSGKPRMSTITVASKRINQLANEQYRWFRPGSGAESEVKTKAKAAIWAKPAQFKKAQDQLRAAAASLQVAVAAGDQKALPSRVKTLGAACAACHNDFRAD